MIAFVDICDKALEGLLVCIRADHKLQESHNAKYRNRITDRVLKVKNALRDLRNAFENKENAYGVTGSSSPL